MLWDVFRVSSRIVETAEYYTKAANKGIREHFFPPAQQGAERLEETNRTIATAMLK